MPVRFARLRLAGFKSFAEPVEIEILSGLTGIVGPNGCGKSNIGDALRFIMGEGSARAMRGGETEDIIFAGTAVRPARNLAEVTLTLEADAHELPVPFESEGTIAIGRQIERGRGSVFRINGREARARDVQTLFADLGSGARSSALIGQGQIAEVIAARPEARRAILEEAAGIVGLHGRRHEAELKLAATEANLIRAEELKAELGQQLAGLRRQARQASRYRNLGAAIRAAESELLAIEKARATASRASRESVLHAARVTAADTAAAAIRTGTAAADATSALPALRIAEQDCRTRLERARLAREQLAAEEIRSREELAEAAARLAELDRDLTHTGALAADAETAQSRLKVEDEGCARALGENEARLAAAKTALEAAVHTLATTATSAEREADTNATIAAQATALDQEGERAGRRLEQLTKERLRLRSEQSLIEAARPPAESLSAAQSAESAAESNLADARANRDRLEATRAAAVAAHEAARERASAHLAERARLAAEVEALSATLLGPATRPDGPPLAEGLSVPPGLEAALAAGLGEALEASPGRWQELPELTDPPPLPAAALALATLVPAPPALARALPFIGLIADPSEASVLQKSLAPGQALVSREGGLWRWDGYVVPPGTESTAGVRLTQRNHLSALKEQLIAAEATAALARTERDRSAESERSITTQVTAAETMRRAAERKLDERRRAAAALRRDTDSASTRIAALTERAARITAEIGETEDAVAKLTDRRAGLPDPATARRTLQSARQALATVRARESAARAEAAALEEKAVSLAARRDGIARERHEWSDRAQSAHRRGHELALRRAQWAAQQSELAARPGALAKERAAAIEALEAVEAAHREARRALGEAEEARTATERLSRNAERQAAEAREAELKCEAAFSQAEVALENVNERIRERLGEGAALPEIPSGADAETAARERLRRLLREREGMGPVNLRAEIEVTELAERADTIEREGDELRAAIAKLRASIGRLNGVGRQRLAAAFTEIDERFRTLFVRMFGGGQARLAMVGSDDPLAAGLEIYAQPPGKKLAQLGLLSGGEQALVALSLIFAVFRCKPSPIAVLDEVDAPLDDANVERFSRLIADVAQACATRMLVVTHHPLTMARMDRLYGVTMQERGVSRLLSVDLATGAELADPSRLAAD